MIWSVQVALQMARWTQAKSALEMSQSKGLQFEPIFGKLAL